MKFAIAHNDPPAWWTKFGLIFFPGHFVMVALTRGVGVEHVISDGFCIFFMLFAGWGRNLVWSLWPFWWMGATYEWFGNIVHWRGDIHVADLFNAEIAWFGVAGAAPDGGIGTWSDYFAVHNHVILDFICGLTYGLHLFQVPIILMVLIFQNPERCRTVAWAILATHLIGMAIWLIYPAAPPWYVRDYGLGPADLDALPSAAGAMRFDELFGISYFTEFYAKSKNVFGAMPSLHAAFPTAAAIALWTYPNRILRWGTISFAVLMSFSAPYLQHHYIWDVIMGWVVAGVGAGTVLFVRSRWQARALQRAADTPAP